jgi:uncharacterized protein YebE (UPF0316 family)
MNIELLLTFIVLNVLNVVIQTVKSICTVKSGKTVAAVVNAVAYGLYTIVIVYTVCDLPLYLKAIIVAIANLIGVYVVKLIEEKSRKDKLWKVELTIEESSSKELIDFLKNAQIPFNYIENIGKYTMFNIFCSTQKQSSAVKQIATFFNAKYFVSESKTL